MTDDVLLRRAADGDEAAFLLLYERHRDIVLRFAYRFLGSMSAAEDVTHDAFLRTLRNPERFVPARASFRTYLCAVARHVALTQRRHDRATLEGGQIDALQDTSSSPGPLSRLLDEELSQEVRRAILALPPSQREAVILFEYEDLSLAEIAAVVGAAVGAVKARLHRAREHLRRELAPYLSGEAGPSLGKRKRETR